MRVLMVATVVSSMLFACSSDPGEPAQEVDSGTVIKDATVKDTAVEPVDTGVDVPDAAVDATPVCADPDDIGGEDSPFKLPSITDKDVTPPHKLSGIISSKSDVDVYTYVGNDASGSIIDFRATTTAANLEICAFIKCVKGTTSINACSKGAAAKNADGNPGCCDATSIAFDWNCKGLLQIDDSANMFIRVKPKVEMCMPYSVEYNL